MIKQGGKTATKNIILYGLFIYLSLILIAYSILLMAILLIQYA